MTLEEKLELLDWLARGENAASVGCHYRVNDCRNNLPHCTILHSQTFIILIPKPSFSKSIFESYSQTLNFQHSDSNP